MTALLGIAWIGSSIAAFAIAFALTDAHGPVPPGLPRYQLPGLGATLVGVGAAGLVFVIGAQASVVRDGRRHPDRRYKDKYSRHWMTIPQAIRHNRRVSVLFLVIAVAGLWLRYGHR